MRAQCRKGPFAQLAEEREATVGTHVVRLAVEVVVSSSRGKVCCMSKQVQ